MARDAPAPPTPGPADSPTGAQLRRYAARRQLELTPAELDAIGPTIDTFVRTLRGLQAIEQPQARLRHPDREAGRQPEPSEDPQHALSHVCEIRGAKTGPLAGMRIGVKDNIAVAGLPMAAGALRPPLVAPGEDAIVVERLLDAGATVVAKTVIGPNSDTTNPIDPAYSTGGSSSGSAVAVATGLVDGALGADQGGSLRVPSAWCGVVGMKATHGLVPTHGLVHWDRTLDHIGPITRTVAGNAAMLDVLAGDDWRDPQYVVAGVRAEAYTTALDRGVRGLRLGVVGECLDRSVCTEDTLRVFAEAGRTLTGAGAELVPVSIPLWAHSHAIWLAVAVSGLAATIESLGQGYGHWGRIDVDRLGATAREIMTGHPPDVHPDVEAMLLTYEHFRETQFGIPFARAQNLRLEMRRHIDRALVDVDLLITPTWPAGPARTVTDQVREQPAGGPPSMPMMNWTSALNLTGHPALTVPAGCGDDGMPRGLQIIGRWLDEFTVYRAGAAVEWARAEA